MTKLLVPTIESWQSGISSLLAIVCPHAVTHAATSSRVSVFQAAHGWFAGIVNPGDEDGAHTCIRVGRMPPSRWASITAGSYRALEIVQPSFKQRPAAEVPGMGPVGYHSTSPA